MSDEELLRAYLAGRDAPCPRCGYNLRGGSAAVCPECGESLSLALGGSNPHAKWRPVIVAALIGFSAYGLVTVVSFGFWALWSVFNAPGALPVLYWLPGAIHTTRAAGLGVVALLRLVLLWTARRRRVAARQWSAAAYTVIGLAAIDTAVNLAMLLWEALRQ